MDQGVDCSSFLLLIIISSYATSFFTQCDARKSLKQHLVTYYSTSDPNVNSYLGSPYYLPPFDDVMGPSSPPLQNPPYCIYPPLNPLPPSTTIPSPILPIQTPPTTFPTLSPPPSISTSPPIFTPNPPEFPTPGPPTYEPSPPSFNPGPPENLPSPPEFAPGPPTYEPSPPSFKPGPPEYFPGPPEFAPGPPIFLPPIVYPPPTVPPPPLAGTGLGLWCVANPNKPDRTIEEAMNYACGSGANCDAIQPNGPCSQPDTMVAHASFAFNSCWQRTRMAGGICDFGGTAMLVTKDPSYDGCHFNMN